MRAVIIYENKMAEKLDAELKSKISCIEKMNALSLDLQLFYMRKTRTGHLEGAEYE